MDLLQNRKALSMHKSCIWPFCISEELLIRKGSRRKGEMKEKEEEQLEEMVETTAIHDNTSHWNWRETKLIYIE